MNESPTGLLEKINTQLKPSEFPSFDEACIKDANLIAYELIDRVKELPLGTKIFSCNEDSHHDPHSWIEVNLPDGQVLVWDRTRQKIKNNDLSTLAEAEKIWPPYKNPSNKLQIIPLKEE